MTLKKFVHLRVIVSSAIGIPTGVAKNFLPFPLCFPVFMLFLNDISFVMIYI